MVDSSFQSWLLEPPLQISRDLCEIFYGFICRLLYGVLKLDFLRCLLWIYPDSLSSPSLPPRGV